MRAQHVMSYHQCKYHGCMYINNQSKSLKGTITSLLLAHGREKVEREREMKSRGEREGQERERAREREREKRDWCGRGKIVFNAIIVKEIT